MFLSQRKKKTSRWKTRKKKLEKEMFMGNYFKRALSREE